MSRKHTVLKVTGVALGAAVIGLAVLRSQAIATKKRVGPRRGAPPFADGRYGPPTGIADRVVVLGDSGAAGLGAPDPEHTMGAVVARGWVALTGRPVRLATVAVVGARTRDLPGQVARVKSLQPTVAVIVIGANDVTHFDNPRTCARLLGGVVADLVESGAEVVVGTCPNVGASPHAPRLLGWVGTTMATRMARAQEEEVRRAGGIPVALADLLDPAFDVFADRMFAEDGFHPSAEGYMAAGLLLLEGLLESRARRLPGLDVLNAVPGPTGDGASYRRAYQPHELPPAPLA
jgi:lysophospholipase L1-like esterase